MLDYFAVSIDGSAATYQIVDDETGTFSYTDDYGTMVDSPVEPIAYLARSWSRPSWAPPLTLAVAAGNRILSKLECMELFTESELVSIYTAAKTIVQIEIWLAKFNQAQEINKDDPRIIAGINSLETAGLIGVGRAKEILDA